METIDQNKLLQNVYKFLEKIQNKLPNELSRECSQIKQAMKKIIPSECETKTPYYINVFDDNSQTHPKSGCKQLNLTQHDYRANTTRLSEKRVASASDSQVSEYMKTLKAVEQEKEIMLERDQLQTHQSRAYTPDLISKQSPAKDHEYFNMQFCDPRYQPKQPNPQYPNPSLISPKEVRRTASNEQKYTNNDFAFTLLPPSNESYRILPTVSTNHPYVNTRLTNCLYQK